MPGTRTNVSRTGVRRKRPPRFVIPAGSVMIWHGMPGASTGCTSHLRRGVRCHWLRIIKTPVRAPRGERDLRKGDRHPRWEILDRLLIVNEHHLRWVLTEYLLHYNTAHRTVLSANSPQLKLAVGPRI
jgi:hypothetical protein